MSPAPKKGQVAAGEKAGGPRVVEWRGTEFTVPAVLPADLAWAMADIESGDGSSVTPILSLLRSIIGTEQEQQLRDKLAADGVSFTDLPDALSELLSALFDAYGMAEGDSPASAPS
mgnify:CR=1 FL=1